MSRRKAREYALKILYLIDAANIDVEKAMADIHGLEEDFDSSDPFVGGLVRGTVQKAPTIDTLIGKYAIGWSLSRMAIVDRALLRLAIFEMFYQDDIPASVSINEAVELANKYSTVDSGKFINGILGKIARDSDEEINSCRHQ